jgi:hypothetical protein
MGDDEKFDDPTKPVPAITPNTELPTEPESESINEKAEEGGIGVDDTTAQQASIVAEKHKMSEEAARKAGEADQLDPENPYEQDLVEDEEETGDADSGGFESQSNADTVQEPQSAEDDSDPGTSKPPEDEVGKAG